MVEPELFASLRPPTYTGAMMRNNEMEHEKLRRAADARARQLSAAGPGGASFGDRDAKKDSDKEAGEAKREYARKLGAQLAEHMDLGRGVQSAATAAALGDFFQYVIDHPVQLPRQKSALLPIVNKPVEGSKVSIYNERTLAKHPLLGLKFKNSSGLHLMQGPITVFEGSNYAGDARILDLQPNEERLISYAIDLGTEAQAIPHAANGRLTAVKIVKGILHTTTKLRESKDYCFKNRSEQDRLIVLEHPFRPEFKLTSADKPVETARDVYRFEVKVPAGEEVKQTVSEERDVASQTVLTNADDNAMRVIINDQVTSVAVKEALRKALDLKWKLALTQQEIANVNRELNQIKQDQPRLRANLEKIPGTDPLAKRILEKLNQQESEIEKYEAQLKQLNAQADQQKKDYEAYLAQLTVE